MQADIAKLRELGATDRADTMQAEFESKYGKLEVLVTDKMIFDTGLNEGEYEETKQGFSNRPPVGEYTAEIGVPEPNYSPKAVKIPVTIIDKGKPWNGYSLDAFYPAKDKNAQFSMKNIAVSAGIKPEKDSKTGNVYFDLSKLIGKKITVVYKLEAGEIDGRTFETSKLKHAKPLGEKIESI
jgi:hypothetical protein